MDILTVIGAYCHRIVGQLVMFLATGILFEFIIEWIKSGIRNRTGKSVPQWIGIVMGFTASAVYIVSAYWASIRIETMGWEIPGSPVFLYVWFLLFYIYQFSAMKIAKPIFKKLLPGVYDSNYVKPQKPSKAEKKEEEFDTELFESFKAFVEANKKEQG